jgi:hypothetical protein
MAVTLTPRSVGLLVGAALATGWMAASIAQDPAPAQSRTATGTRAPLGVTPGVPRAERLHNRVIEPPLPARGRNPFIYGPRAPRSRSSGERAVESSLPAAAPPIAGPVEPPPPLFTLSGIASNMENGATVLTAIVIDQGSVMLVKAGDKLSNGYSVVRVDDLSVTIADASGVTQTLRLP